MKLGAYVCNACGAGVDTDDPRWLQFRGDYWHECAAALGRELCAPLVIPGETQAHKGRAVLRRSAAREEQLADERERLLADSARIDRDRNEARRQARVAELRRRERG